MNYYKKVLGAASEEIKAIFRSWYMFAFVSWIPLIGFGMIIAIFFNGVPRDLPIGVVDKDSSRFSRMQLSAIESSATLHISEYYSSVHEASTALRDGSIYAIIIIPEHFEKQIRQGVQPAISVMLNTQFILMSKILKSALSSVLMNTAATLDFVQTLAQDQRPELAKSAVAPIQIQITPFFNTYNNYFLFLVSAMLPAFWSILVMLTMVIALGEMFKNRAEGVWLEKAGGSVSAAMLGKMLPYSVIQMLWGMAIVYFVYGVMPWPFMGSWWILAAGMFLTVIVYQVLAYAFYAIEYKYDAALSFTAVFTAPAFAAMGITFPLMNMEGVAVAWHELLPISHYIHIQISQANYGAPLASVWGAFGMLALFLVITPLVYWRYKVRSVRWTT